jgi:hypothetical protein
MRFNLLTRKRDKLGTFVPRARLQRRQMYAFRPESQRPPSRRDVALVERNQNIGEWKGDGSSGREALADLYARADRLSGQQ